MQSELLEDGVVPIHNVFSNAELARIKSKISDVVALGTNVPGGYQAEFEETGAIRKLRRLYWNDLQFWSDVFLSAGIKELATSLVGPLATLVFHAALLKPAFSGSPVAPHQHRELWQNNYGNAVSM